MARIESWCGLGIHCSMLLSYIASCLQEYCICRHSCIVVLLSPLAPITLPLLSGKVFPMLSASNPESVRRHIISWMPQVLHRQFWNIYLTWPLEYLPPIFIRNFMRKFCSWQCLYSRPFWREERDVGSARLLGGGC